MVRARGLTAAAGVTAIGLALLAGCSSGSDDAGPTASAAPTVTVTETVTTTATTSPSPSPTTTATGAAGSGACGTADVSASVTAGDAGAGQRRATLVLTNVSDTACTITGYPGLQLVTASGAKVPTKVVRVTSPAARTVTVKPGRTASSTLTFGVVPNGDEPSSGPCEQEAAALRVIPPDATKAVTAPWSLGPVCNSGKISANAFVKG